MGRTSDTAGAGRALPGALEVVLDDYVDHLVVWRSRSESTARSYRSDVAALLTHLSAAGAGPRTAADLAAVVTLPALRGWLAAPVASGASRSTVARRLAAARSFRTWAARARGAGARRGGRAVPPGARWRGAWPRRARSAPGRRAPAYWPRTSPRGWRPRGRDATCPRCSIPGRPRRPCAPRIWALPRATRSRCGT